MILSKRDDIYTLTDIRTIIAMQAYNVKGVRGKPDNLKRIMNSDLSWQERIKWMKRINGYTGKKGENKEWLSIIHNSESVALELLEKKRLRVSGDKNPGYQHGGKLSVFSDKFIGNASKEDAITKMKKTMALNPHNQNTKIEYYLNKGMSRQDAEKALFNRQAVGRLDKFIERYGEEDGIKRWKERQEKWLKSYKRVNFSKISQELFWSISNELGDINQIYFAELDEDKNPDLSGRNHELRLNLECTILPDFVDMKRKKVIEFDGTYWHGEVGHGNKERERMRDDMIIANGFEVLHVNESDYKNNPQREIDRCIRFLKL